MNFVDYIGIQDNAVSSHDCKSIIEFFECHKNEHTTGVVLDRGGEEFCINESVKKSIDLCRTFDKQEIPEKIIINCIKNFVPQYQKKYDSLDKIEEWTLCNNYNIRRYDPGMAFYAEHCEVHGKGKSENRMLTWMLYLNTVNDGGETFFRFQQYSSKAEEGKFLVWPPYWTHPHNGLTSNSCIKYIATGWFVFL